MTRPSPSGAVLADAPGRVNLIGEHTDYNQGFVLPVAIPQRTRVTLVRRRDQQVMAASDAAGCAEATYTLGEESPGRGWLDYVQGVTWALARAGHRFGGFDLGITSDVPPGSGLSSSAALEVALLRALRQAFALDLDDVRLALLGQKAENGFVGARTGIMDQFAASLADERTALFVDTRDLSFERVPLPAEAELGVIHSGVVHDHASGAYNTRRAECEEACARLGVASLRDVTLADLSWVQALPDPLDRRARHVVTENARVLDAVAALRSANLPTLGALLTASHASLRDDYAVSVPEVDLLVAEAQAQPEVFGARITGGGFGGSIVLVARAGTAAAVTRRVAAAYAARTSRTPTILVPRPADG